MTLTQLLLPGAELRMQQQRRDHTEMGAASGGVASGAPWWLTIVLPIITALIAHHLTVLRERSKHDRDWLGKWHGDAKMLLAKISNSAIQHYVDSDSVRKTALSAGLIISDIRRLRVLVHEAVCIDPSDSKITTDAIHAFDEAISSHDDFQNTERVTLLATDTVCTSIRACEEQLAKALGRPRKRRVV
ncbi:hypothetical protein [Marilutibacter chinensis]|uniref:Uncharacterized protein n=1 Tax=Marilutibacter chinensis TaxID=2912247 RepID=A0ABS9HQ41_9GAMM|nr:hypothetical protein [Lysobacter chinensis]MCF7220763.1 hypothetical protein [Lysobacter chinensis]